MTVTMAWGASYQVLMEVGFIVREFKLDSSVLDGTDVLDGTLDGIDVTEYIQDLTIKRGRSDQLQDFSSGTCSIVLNNNDRRFDPVNTASPYVDPVTLKSGVTPRRKVTVYHGTTSLFVGRITDIDITYEPTLSTQSTVNIDCADDFVLLASSRIDAQTPTPALSGSVVTSILDLPEVAYPATRNIDAGITTLGAIPISDGTNALSYLMKVAQTERGYLFIDRTGDLRFSDRNTADFSPSVLTFADNGTGTKYSSITIQYGQELLYNRVVCTNEGGTPQVADDAASQTEFNVSTLSISGLLFSTDAQALVLASFLLDLYKDPLYRFDGINVDFAGSNISLAEQNTIVALDLGSVITVLKSYGTGSPSSVSQILSIEGLEHHITPLAHSIRFGFAIANILYTLLLDDSVFGVLDSDNALS